MLRFGRRATFWALVVPSTGWLLLFFVAPLVLIVTISFRADLRVNLLEPFTPTLLQYEKLLDKPAYLRLFGTSVGIAFVVASVASILAFPLAYFLVFQAGPRAGVYLLLLLLPFWTSYLLRVMAWKVMLGSSGVINEFLIYARAIDTPLEQLLYNRFAVIVTLIYVWVPFVALPIYAVLQRIDPALLEAAADLGAAPTRRLLHVVLPLSLPGVIAGFFTCFIPTVGEYVTPLLVGGSKGSMYGNLIQDFFTKAANWPFGAALALVMLVATLVLTAVAVRLADLRSVAQ
jgi:spermidine/putrescine transport system permease protein